MFKYIFSLVIALSTFASAASFADGVPNKLVCTYQDLSGFPETLTLEAAEKSVDLRNPRARTIDFIVNDSDPQTFSVKETITINGRNVNFFRRNPFQVNDISITSIQGAMENAVIGSLTTDKGALELDCHFDSAVVAPGEFTCCTRFCGGNGHEGGTNCHKIPNDQKCFPGPSHCKV